MNGAETAAVPPQPAPGSSLTRALPVWFAVAALAQVAYLAHWPLYLFGRAVPYPLAIAVALVRLGIYSGLSAGLATGQRSAWAAAILELFRTFALMAVLFLLRRWQPSSLLYPAGWTQGAVSGVLPLIFALNLAVAKGWRPGGRLEYALFVMGPVLAGTGAMAAVALRRESARFRIPASGERLVLLRDGLPLVLLLAAVEGFAFLVSGGVGSR